MASTNKTTNYELSQYIGTDKPTYLTDYNQDMAKIDAGIHSAKSEADTNASAIGTLSNLETETKTSLVASINEVVGDVTTNTNNISTNTSNIATNTTAIGTLANLTTSAKTSLVVAANEINAKVGSLASLETDAKSSTVAAINEIAEYLNFTHFEDFDPAHSGDITVTNGTLNATGGLHCASNTDGSLAKIYGVVTIDISSTTATPVVSFQTRLRPESEITINALGINKVTTSSEPSADIRAVDITISTNGVVSMSGLNASYMTANRFILHPCLLYIKDFGDIPTPEE